jgi:hypothetical protein
MLVYDVIGHEETRARLKGWEGSFAVVGPPGTGKKGIVLEWALSNEIDVDIYPSLWIDDAKILAEKAYARPGITALLDGDQTVWGPLLKPVEEGALRVGVWAVSLPANVRSRMALFATGLLSDSEVSQILARDFPTYGPRPWLVKALMGNLFNLDLMQQAVQVFELVDAGLSAKKAPKELRTDSIPVLLCLRLACVARLGSPNLPWSSGALAAISRDAAWKFLMMVPRSTKSEARNTAELFFRSLNG